MALLASVWVGSGCGDCHIKGIFRQDAGEMSKCWERVGQCWYDGKMIRWMTILFVGFILLVVVLANQAALPSSLAAVYDVPYGDKVGHFFLMGVLSLLVNLSWRGAKMRLGRWELLKGSFWIVLFVVLEEVTQLFNPNRTFSWADLAADGLGVWLFGQLAVWLLKRPWATKKGHLERDTPV